MTSEDIHIIEKNRMRIDRLLDMTVLHRDLDGVAMNAIETLIESHQSRVARGKKTKKKITRQIADELRSIPDLLQGRSSVEHRYRAALALLNATGLLAISRPELQESARTVFVEWYERIDDANRRRELQDVIDQQLMSYDPETRSYVLTIGGESEPYADEPQRLVDYSTSVEMRMASANRMLKAARPEHLTYLLDYVCVCLHSESELERRQVSKVIGALRETGRFDQASVARHSVDLYIAGQDESVQTVLLNLIRRTGRVIIDELKERLTAAHVSDEVDKLHRILGDIAGQTPAAVRTLGEIAADSTVTGRKRELAADTLLRVRERAPNPESRQDAEKEIGQLGAKLERRGDKQGRRIKDRLSDEQKREESLQEQIESFLQSQDVSDARAGLLKRRGDSALWGILKRLRQCDDQADKEIIRRAILLIDRLVHTNRRLTDDLSRALWDTIRSIGDDVAREALVKSLARAQHESDDDYRDLLHSIELQTQSPSLKNTIRSSWQRLFSTPRPASYDDDF